MIEGRAGSLSGFRELTVMDEWFERTLTAGVVVVITLILAGVVDRWLVRSLELRPETLTRYRVLRRSAVVTIVTVGVLSALLVIPQVRAVAGTILASSAVIALVVGFAAQSTLANFVAGILVAFTQPVRLGDRVSVSGAEGTVEEIGLTYTLIRTFDGAHFFVPNVKLASDTIRNSTISSPGHLAQVSVAVPIRADLEQVQAALVTEARAAFEAMLDKEPAATVTKLEATHTVVTVEAWARSELEADRLSNVLRALIHRRLRAEGIYE
jgi:small-conductance mechanosensitive channel